MAHLRILFLAAVIALLLPGPAVSQVVSGGMPTMETAFFSRLEERFFQAIVAQQRARLGPFLAQSFELRTARSGGELTLRDEWLAAATSSYQVHSYRLRGLAVRSFGDTAVVSFLYEQKATVAGRDLSGGFFVVDVWRKTGKDWKLAARYSAGPGAVPEPSPNVKIKE